MAYQPVEKLLPRSGYNVYKLILLASRRAMELADGQPKLIDFPSGTKATTIALDEIMAGKVKIKGIVQPEELVGQAVTKDEKAKKKK